MHYVDYIIYIVVDRRGHMRQDVAKLMNALGTYKFFSTISGATNKCLDVEKVSQTPSAPVILCSDNRQDNQAFHICHIKDGYFAIIASHSLMALDVKNYSACNCTPVIQYPYHGGDNQLWKLKQVDGGLYIICSKLNEKLVLDITKANKADGTPIIIYEYRNTPNQKFKLSAV